MLHLFFKKGPYFNGDMDDMYTSWTVGVALTRAIELSVTVLVGVLDQFMRSVSSRGLS